MKLPALGTITSYSLADNVGRISLDDGTVLRVGSTRLPSGVLPRPGTRVRVLRVETHRLGGLKAVEVAPADTVMTEGQHSRELNAYLESQGTGPHADLRASTVAMSWAKPEPLTARQQAELDAHHALIEETARRENARAAEAKREMLRARLARATRPPAEAWGQILRDAVVPPRTTIEVLARARPAAGFVSDVETPPRPGITSRLGGVPDVPGGFRWPTYQDTSLSFVAQIRVSELPAGVRADLMLPSDGLLSFFYETTQQEWGFEPEHRGAARVFWFPRVEQLAREGSPDDLEDGPLPDAGVVYVDELSLPSLESPSGPTLGSVTADAYLAGRAADEAARGLLHKVGGYADEIQGAMELECAAVTHGVSFADGSPKISADVREEAPQWRLLLQLDTDLECGMEWGDSGRMFFWIREDHLRAQAFERAWCILQCY